MKVKELITELEKFNGEDEVLTAKEDYFYTIIKTEDSVCKKIDNHVYMTDLTVDDLKFELEDAGYNCDGIGGCVILWTPAG